MDNLNWKEDLPQYTEPSAIKKWRFLSSWEQYIGEIYAVEKEDGELIIYFELFVSHFSVVWSDHLRFLFVGRVRIYCAEKIR